MAANTRFGLMGSMARSTAPVVSLSPASTRIHVEPPSVDLYTPRSPPALYRCPVTAAKMCCGLVGSTANRPMAPVSVSPTSCQVAPPSTDR